VTSERSIQLKGVPTEEERARPRVVGIPPFEKREVWGSLPRHHKFLSLRGFRPLQAARDTGIIPPRKDGAPMRRLALVVVLTLMVVIAGHTSAPNDWAINATAIEACSCPHFCICYFNTHPRNASRSRTAGALLQVQ
jgi:hypothetical protein